MSLSFGKYKSLKLLGEGASSLVYLAQSPHLSKPVAIKVFKNSHNALDVDFSTFKAEADVMYRLNGHANVISLMDVDQSEDGTCFIVMPFIENSLSAIIKQSTSLSFNLFISLCDQILTGLMSIHAINLVHGDIKPANVLIDAQNRVYLADFGIARDLVLDNRNQASSGNSLKSKTSGTSEYRAPEIFKTNLSTSQSDIFAAGIVFSKLIGLVNQKDKQCITLIDALKDFIARCIAKRPEHRFASAQDALKEFQGLVIAHSGKPDYLNTSASKLNDDITSTANNTQGKKSDRARKKTDKTASQTDEQDKSDNTGHFYQEDLTQEINNEAGISEESKALIMMIRAMLIHKGRSDKKILASVLKSEEFNRFWKAHYQDGKSSSTYNPAEQVKAKREVQKASGKETEHQKEVLQSLIDSVVLTLNKEYPDWQSASHQSSVLGRPFANSGLLFFGTRAFKRSFLVFLLIVFTATIFAWLRSPSLFVNDSNTHDLSHIHPELSSTNDQAEPPSESVLSKNSFNSLFDSLLDTKNNEDEIHADKNNTQAISPDFEQTERLKDNSIDGVINYTDVRFITIPQLAKVLVFTMDGNPVSLNPRGSALLAYGEYQVRTSLNGYQTSNETISLNKEEYIHRVELDLGDSQYFIDSAGSQNADGIALHFSLIPRLETDNSPNTPKQQDISIFRMMSVEVTNQLYEACVTQGACRSNKKRSTDPRQARFESQQYPAVNVSWFDVTEAFIPWLSAKTGSSLRLPTEQEWQHAAAAGVTTRFSFGDSLQNGMAHCRDCTFANQRSTMPVRSFEPNTWGLFDMHGNVQEWTSDCWQASKQTPLRCDQAVIKGGSWLDPKAALALNARTFLSKRARSHTTGFRLVEIVDAP